MNVVRFYETLAKIIGERENVEIRVSVREVMESDCSVQASTNGSRSHETESEFCSVYGAGLTPTEERNRENPNSPHTARRTGRKGQDRQCIDRGSESGARLVGA